MGAVGSGEGVMRALFELPKRWATRGAGGGLTRSAGQSSRAGEGRSAEFALFDRVFSVLGPVAERAAGQPTWLVKPALRRAWREVFDADLGEPTLTWVAQAIQDRQPAAIGWRTPAAARREPPGRPNGSPAGAPRAAEPPPGTGVSTHTRSRRVRSTDRRAATNVPGEWRYSDLELPATGRALARVPELLGTLLAAWGEDAQRLVEEAQLVTSAVLASALDRADPGSWLKLAVAYRLGTLRMRLTVELAQDTGSTLPTPPVRHRRRAAHVLLDSVAAAWGRREHPGGERIWFELRPRTADPDRPRRARR
jgi:hypothetical protein